MIKVIPSDSFDYGTPAASLVDLHSRGIDKDWMHKRAAVQFNVMKDLRPERGYSFLHLIDMGSMEAYGMNRNADAFNEKAGSFTLANPKASTPKVTELGGGLEEFHPTFSKYAHVYKHHKNKDPKKAIGEVKAAAYNKEMKRGELIIKVPHGHEWDSDLEKMANGKDIPFSMACKVPYDICTNCGNRAPSRDQYCDCLKNHMSEILKCGSQIGAINDRPLFFDISKVFKPADRIAYSLQKVAEDLYNPIGGAALAELLEVSAPSAILLDGSTLVTRKQAAANKLAEIEKRVEGAAQGKHNTHLKKMTGACAHKEIPVSAMAACKAAGLNASLNALGNARICLCPRDFFELMMEEKFASVSDDIPTVEGMLPGLFQRLLESGEANDCVLDTTYDVKYASVPRYLQNVTESLAKDHSLGESESDYRLRLSVIRGESPKLSSETVKRASVSKSASLLAKEYAKYLIAFSTQNGDSETCDTLTVMRNYLTF